MNDFGNDHYKFVNTPLPYSFDAMEPYIDEKTMWLHHDRHLQTYIDQLNAALEDWPLLQRMTLEQLLVNLVYFPQGVKTAVRHNGGGVYNHRFFFRHLKNPGDPKPSGALGIQISRYFGSYEMFQKELTEAALGVFGSGYAWLVTNRAGELRIVTTANQDCPLTQGWCPILNIDVWEHAYYLKHYNVRKAYIEDWFQIINWKLANDNFECCVS